MWSTGQVTEPKHPGEEATVEAAGELGMRRKEVVSHRKRTKSGDVRDSQADPRAGGQRLEEATPMERGVCV